MEGQDLGIVPASFRSYQRESLQIQTAPLGTCRYEQPPSLGPALELGVPSHKRNAIGTS